MPAKFSITNGGNRKSVSTRSIQDDVMGEKTYLLAGSNADFYCHWKAISGTVAGTSIVTAPSLGGGIGLTDLLIAGEKKNTGTIEVRFTDDTNTITIFKAPLTDNAIAIPMSMKGIWYGWENARLEVITVQDFIHTVTAGYIKQREGQPYEEWDSER